MYKIMRTETLTTTQLQAMLEFLNIYPLHGGKFPAVSPCEEHFAICDNQYFQLAVENIGNDEAMITVYFNMDIIKDTDYDQFTYMMLLIQNVISFTDERLLIAETETQIVGGIHIFSIEISSNSPYSFWKSFFQV